MEFSELEHFAHIPVYQYSSGMSLRLAFGMSTYAAPEILVIDEIISVGDLDFEKKSKKRIGGNPCNRDKESWLASQ